MSVLSADSDSRLFSDNDGERVYFSDCPQNLVQFNLRKYPIITTRYFFKHKTKMDAPINSVWFGLKILNFHKDCVSKFAKGERNELIKDLIINNNMV